MSTVQMIHISTPETFMADAIAGEATCPVCLHRVTMRHGWLDSHCPNCDSYVSVDAPMRTVRLRREYLGLTIQEMAGRTGLKPSTIKKYENDWRSRAYWNKTKRMVADR